MAAYKSRREMLSETTHGELRRGALYDDDDIMKRRPAPDAMAGTKITPPPLVNGTHSIIEISRPLGRLIRR